MPDVTQISYRHNELVQLMLKDQGITEGHWILSVNFGLGAGNIGDSPERPEAISPAAFVIVQSVGLHRVPAPQPHSVDAAALATRQ